MTVESNLARISYTISGAGPYTIPYYFLDDGDLIVIETDTGGNSTTLTITTDYTLTGAGDEDGGSLTLVSPTNGNTLIIINEPAITQLTQYPETGKFPAASHERALDKLTMIAKRIYDMASRSLRLNDGDTATIPELPPSSPGKLIGWDVGGNLTNTSPAGVGPASIGEAELAAGAVTNAKLAAGAVTNAKLADVTLVALAGLDATAGLVEQTGADTFIKRAIGTAPGNVPLVGTKSATETVAGLVELAIQTEAEAGADDTAVMTPLKTAQAIAALGLGGSGQTWQDVKTSPGRALNTTYTNTTGKPIAVSIQTTNTGSSQAILTVGGVAIYGSSPGTATSGFVMTVSAIVPVGATYIASNTNQTLDHWRELTV